MRTPKRKNQVIQLTPRLYRELDILTRKMAGTVIEIVNQDQLPPQCFAMVDRDAYYEDPTSRYLTEKRVIRLSNQIEVGWFRLPNERPLDWTKIPDRHIPHFIVFHEIGHLLFDRVLLPQLDIPISLARIHMEANEYRADSFAWRCLYGKVPAPIRHELRKKTASLETFMQEHPAYFRQEAKSVEPLGLALHLNVPRSHREHGIPWAKGVDANPFLWAEQRAYRTHLRRKVA